MKVAARRLPHLSTSQGIHTFWNGNCSKLHPRSFSCLAFLMPLHKSQADAVKIHNDVMHGMVHPASTISSLSTNHCHFFHGLTNTHAQCSIDVFTP